MARQHDYLFKMLLIGDSGVGKTCLLVRFAEDSFHTSYISTIGIDFKIRTLEIEGKKVKIQIWDTAGQERFKTITTAYYRGAQGILLVYDVTNPESFSNIKEWLGRIEEHASQDVEKMLVGNKCDMTPLRRVTFEQGQKLAHSNGLAFRETSAKSSLNVLESFTALAVNIKHKVDAKLLQQNPNAVISPTRDVKEPSKEKKRSFFSSCSIL